MALPTASNLTSATTTNAQMKTYLQGMRDFIANLLGTTETPAAARTALGSTAVGDSLFTAANAAAARTAVDAAAPAFSATPSAVTSLTSGVPTKVTFATEEFDHGGHYNAASSRFQPTVAGVYWIAASVRLNATATQFLYIYKNGLQHREIGTTAQTSNQQSSGGALVTLNGSTDYVEIYCTQSAATQNSQTSAVNTWFQGHLVRAA